MKLTSCGVLLCIIVASAQIEDEYGMLDSEEAEIIKSENVTKDGELKKLFDNVSSTFEP